MTSPQSKVAARDIRIADGKVKGIRYRLRADGSKSWQYFDARLGRYAAASSRQDAIDRKGKASLDKSAGLPAPDTRVRIRDLAEEAREAKRRRLRPSSCRAWEDALDRVILPEVGHLKPMQLGADRVARLIRDLEERGLTRDTIIKYLQPLNAIVALAVRRGMIASSPVALLSPDERPKTGERRQRFEWSPASISGLIAAADRLGKRPEARYNYAPLIHVLALTGLRVSEALALRWGNVDLLGGFLRVDSSLGRDGGIGKPKTAAGIRRVPLTPGLVDVLVRLKPLEARDEAFVFSGKLGKPLGYWNFRNRGFQKAVQEAGLEGNVTVHDLRHAAASVYIASGLSPVEVAHVLGHGDAGVTLRVYAHLFDRGHAEARIRAAQASVITSQD